MAASASATSALPAGGRTMEAAGLARFFGRALHHAPKARELLAVALWGGLRQHRAAAGGGRGDSAAAAAAAAAEADPFLVQGSVETAGSGAVLIRAFTVDLRWDVPTVKKEIARRLGDEDQAYCRVFVGHGGPELEQQGVQDDEVEPAAEGTETAVAGAEVRKKGGAPRLAGCKSTGSGGSGGGRGGGGGSGAVVALPRAGRVVRVADLTDGFVLAHVRSSFLFAPAWWRAIKDGTAAFRGHQGSVRAVAMSRGGTRVVTGGMDDGEVNVWDFETGEQLASCLRPRAAVRQILSVATAKDGLVVAASSQDAVTVWDLQEAGGHGEEAGVRFALGAPGAPMFLFQMAVVCVDLSEDATRLLVGHAGAVTAYDVRTKEELLHMEVPRCSLQAMKATPDLKLAVVGDDQGSAYVLDLEARRVAQTFSQCHQGPVMAVTIADPETRAVAGRHPTAATGAGDRMTRLWDVAEGREVRNFETPLRVPVRCVSISRDGTRLFTGSSDGVVRQWDTASGREVRQWIMPARACAFDLAVTPDARFVVVATAEGSVPVRYVPSG